MEKWDAYASLLEKASTIAHHAGTAIMNIYGGKLTCYESDASPVTEADELGRALILPALQALDRGIPCVAEEAGCRRQYTKKPADRFLAGRDPWRHKRIHQPQRRVHVNIALIENGVPVTGVVWRGSERTVSAVGLRARLAFVEERRAQGHFQCRRAAAG